MTTELQTAIELVDACADTLSEARERLEKAQEALDHYEPDSDDADVVEVYEEMLDEVHGEFLGMSASRILKEMDETAYRCGMNDWLDGIDDKSGFSGYEELEEARDDAQDEVDDAERELEDAEEEVERLENEEE